jgi:hypothetical protein
MVLMVAACLAVSGCTSNGGAAIDGSASAPGDAPDADPGTEPGDAVPPATGNVNGGAARVAPDLPPPMRPPAPALDPGAEAALAMMPGLHGLVHLRTKVLDERIAFEANADSVTVMDILQSGQWALQPGDGGPAAVDESDPAADGVDGAVTRLATLRLGGDIAQVQLGESDGVCSGVIARP